MSQQTLEGRCPKCGRELSVPAELEKFSCLYCGARLRPDGLLPITPPDGDALQALDYVKTHIAECLRNYPDYPEKITRWDYRSAFEVYEYQTREIFEQLDLACRLEPQERGAWLTQAAEQYLDDMQADIDSAGGKRRRRQKLFDAKLITALFMVPAIRHLHLSTSEDFAEALHASWCRRYPDERFQPGTYEEIVSGFHKHGFCFITTAVCQAEGKPDDCAELTAFRRFRDGYLQSQPDGPACIEEYYDLAPALVNVIHYCTNAERVYAWLRRDYLRPCYEALCSGRPAACKERYTEMMQQLKKRFLPSRLS